MTNHILLLAFTLAALVPAADAAMAEAQPSDARLVGEVTSIRPAEPFWVGLHIRLDPGWHSYWKNPGDSGSAPIIDWKLPAGFEAGEIQWPYPKLIRVPPLATYGYEDEVLHPILITPPADLRPGASVTLAGQVDYVICEEECIPASAALRLTLPVRAAQPQLDGQWQSAFAAARARLPRSAAGWQAQAASDARGYRLELRPAAGASLDGAHFFAADSAIVDHAGEQSVTRAGDAYTLTLPRSEYAAGPAERLRGVLVLAGAATPAAVEFDIPVEDGGALSVGAIQQPGATFLLAIGLALVGGLILNLMPCVFPVLSLKVLGFLQQGEGSATRARIHGLAFVGGLIMTFWAIAGLLLVLRAAGSSLGWGFQLQSPLFIAFLSVLFFLLALNMLGMFELGLAFTRLGRFESHAQTYSSSFLTGVLATVVATPCTAPFMGSALGVALAQSAGRAFLIFTALGLGMALPYLLLAMRPSLLRVLPRPGPWMVTFRQFLAFPLLATVIWLLWVFGMQTGVDGVSYLLAGLLALALALWFWQRKHIVTRGLAALLVVAGLAAAYSGAGHEPPAAYGSAGATASGVVWERFSPARVEELRAQGRTVFIDFTAAWCITCQVNKRTTFTAASVEEAFREQNVALLVADWTRYDSEITQALQSFGRSGVPLYVLYDGNADPVVLPEILTTGIMLNALRSVSNDLGKTQSNTDISQKVDTP